MSGVLGLGAPGLFWLSVSVLPLLCAGLWDGEPGAHPAVRGQGLLTGVGPQQGKGWARGQRVPAPLSWG